ncbi:MAG: DUF4346 domain-containing protein [Deltaproteobacteria bacterium]|jgi:thymidylate synthase|nr:DUF4346 domain-containing protein [Deltaproteobacteria bacterium]
MLDFQFAIQVKDFHEVNPLGTVALCSLWTPPSYIFDRLKEIAPKFLEKDSPLAVIGKLYGGGLKIMLRNLHHNPQLDTVILCGKDFAGAGELLLKFFQGKYERTGKKQAYIFDDGKKEELETIAISGEKSIYQMDDLLLPDMFITKPKILELKSDRSGTSAHRIVDFFQTYKRPLTTPEARPSAIPLPRPQISIFPAERFGGSVIAESIREAWSEILFRLDRFGVPTLLRKGKERRELNNFKTTILKPDKYSLEELTSPPYNLKETYILSYQEEIMEKKNLYEGIPYTYGNRIRSHFGADLLEKAALYLAADLDGRHGFIDLWDNSTDMGADDAPCLVSLYFRKIEEKIHLTATFRSHNATHAWPLNCLGLVKLMEYVVQKINLNKDKQDPYDYIIGTLTVMSLSLTFNLDDLVEVSSIIEARKNTPYRMADDPHGYFQISLDFNTHEIVVQHLAPTSELLEEYRGSTASELSKKLYNNMALSDLGHAMYLGSQLERAWYCLENGLEFIQDKTKLPKT